MISCTCTHVKSPHTRAGNRKPDGGHPWKWTQTLSFSFSIAVRVFSCLLFPMLPTSFFSATTTLSFHAQSLSVSFLILFFPMLLTPSFLLPFVLCVRIGGGIGGGWCGRGDYSSDQHCRAVGSSVIKMADSSGSAQNSVQKFCAEFLAEQFSTTEIQARQDWRNRTPNATNWFFTVRLVLLSY